MADAIVSLEALFKQYQDAVEKQVLAALDQVMDSMAQAQSRITELETELASEKRRSAELQLEVERLDHQRTMYLSQRDEARAEAIEHFKVRERAHHELMKFRRELKLSKLRSPTGDCVCRRGDEFAHVHYAEPPHACARCSCTQFSLTEPELPNFHD